MSQETKQNSCQRCQDYVEGIRLGKGPMGQSAFSPHIYSQSMSVQSPPWQHHTIWEGLYSCTFHKPPTHIQIQCFIKIPDETRSKLDDKAKECQLIRFKGDSIYIVINLDQKKLGLRNVIFIESQTSWNEAVEPPIEFLRQTAEVIDDNNDLDEKDKVPGQWTRSEVWDMDPMRWSEWISNRVLITKTTDSAPAIKKPKTYKDAVESLEGVRATLWWSHSWIEVQSDGWAEGDIDSQVHWHSGYPQRSSWGVPTASDELYSCLVEGPQAESNS